MRRGYARRLTNRAWDGRVTPTQTYTKSSIEALASHLRADTLGDHDVPVEVEAIVDRMGGSIEVRRDGHKDPESLHVGAESFTVFIPPHTSMLRDRFTIAHELGHLVLHHDREAREPQTFYRYGRSRQETEANAFAGALLMPAREFTEAWDRCGGDLRALSREFLVSQTAAGVRAQVLGL